MPPKDATSQVPDRVKRSEKGTRRILRPSWLESQRFTRAKKLERGKNLLLLSLRWLWLPLVSFRSCAAEDAWQRPPRILSTTSFRLFRRASGYYRCHLRYVTAWLMTPAC